MSGPRWELQIFEGLVCHTRSLEREDEVCLVLSVLFSCLMNLLSSHLTCGLHLSVPPFLSQTLPASHPHPWKLLWFCSVKFEMVLCLGMTVLVLVELTIAAVGDLIQAINFQCLDTNQTFPDGKEMRTLRNRSAGLMKLNFPLLIFPQLVPLGTCVSSAQLKPQAPAGWGS